MKILNKEMKKIKNNKMKISLFQIKKMIKMSIKILNKGKMMIKDLDNVILKNADVQENLLKTGAKLKQVLFNLNGVT